MNFTQPMWLIAVGHLMGCAGLGLGLLLLASGLVELQWALVYVVGHVLASLMVSVGLHRYFSHGSFKTTPFWHNFMAFYSVMLLQGSALGWSAAHITHHVYSDTERDPHMVKWHYLLWKRYNRVRMVRRRLRRVIGDNALASVHRYGTLLWLFTCACLLAAGWKIFLFGYLMPLGSVHLIGAIHQVTSHKGEQPRNLAFMEYILPAMGEWMHKTHHDHPGRKDLRTRWWHLDLGYLFIRLIERR